jgi:trimeric autotransporter adhesin
MKFKNKLVNLVILALMSAGSPVTYAQTELCASGPAGSGGLSNKAPLGAGSVTLGCNHQNINNGILFGNNSILKGADGVALYQTTTTTNANGVVSNGEATFYDASNVTNVGNGTVVNAGGAGASNFGTNNTINGANAAVAGNGNTINGANVANIGNGNTVNGANASVFGSGVGTVAAGGTVIGNGTAANNANDVALGTGSSTAAAVGTAGVTLNGTGYTFAGTTPTSTVSVGAAGAERTITNVAAGGLTTTSTDAVNGSQLNATNTALAVTDARVTTVDNRLTTIDNRATTVDNRATVVNDRATVVDNRLTTIDNRATTVDNRATVVNDRATVVDNRLTTIDNRATTVDNRATVVNDRATVVDNRLTTIDNRVTVVDARVTDVDNRLTNIAGNTSTTYTDTNGMGIRYARTNEAGLPKIDSYATGKGSTAVGYGAKSEGTNSLALGNGATATNAGDIALGAGSTTTAAVATTGTTINGTSYSFAGTAPTSTMSVGSVGAERTITNVAAGRVSATSTDAVNGSQLHATNTALEKLGERAVKYDLNPDGTVNYTKSTMAGPVSTDGGKTGGTTITNVHQGAVNANSTDAVNGAQLYNVAGDTSITYTTTNGRGVRYSRTNDTGLVESDAFAQGSGSTAVGYGATTTKEATNGVALGNGATSSYTGAVAIGAGSVASGPGVSVSGTTINGQTYTFAGANGANQGVVSFGSAGNERQVTNVAAGQLNSNSTDAVNGSQLFASNQAVERLNGQATVIDNRITVLDRSVLKYDIRGDGTVNYNNVTLGGDDGAKGPVSLKNVAAGRASNDLANFGQLGATDKSTSSGIAAALATAALPQALDGNKKMIAAGIGAYNNQLALSVGASAVSDNERMTLKGAISAGTNKNVGVNLSVGMHF